MTLCGKRAWICFMSKGWLKTDRHYDILFNWWLDDCQSLRFEASGDDMMDNYEWTIYVCWTCSMSSYSVCISRHMSRRLTWKSRNVRLRDRTLCRYCLSYGIYLSRDYEIIRHVLRTCWSESRAPYQTCLLAYLHNYKWLSHDVQMLLILIAAPDPSWTPYHSVVCDIHDLDEAV